MEVLLGLLNEKDRIEWSELVAFLGASEGGGPVWIVPELLLKCVSRNVRSMCMLCGGNQQWSASEGWA